MDKNSLDQGNVNAPDNAHPQDPHSQAAGSGKGTKNMESGGPLDAAQKSGKKAKPRDTGEGNPEGIGIVNQVGSAGSSAEHFERKQK